MEDDLPGGVYRTEPIGHIDDHLRWMRRSGAADSTLRTRRRTLTLLAEHLGHDPATATLAELEAWQDVLAETSANHLRHQTHLVRPYFRWLQARGHRHDNPAELLATPRRPRKLPHPIEDPDLMRAVDGAPDRVLPWLLLAGWCGMRASDIAVMRAEQIHVDVHGNRWVRVAGKNGVERDIPLPGWVWTIIGPLAEPSGWCWRRVRGHGKGELPPTAQHVSQYCNDYLHDVVGIPETLHTLRHRAATAVLEQTGNLRLVQEMLGHSDIGTVANYTRVRSTAIAGAVDGLPRPAGVPAAAPSSRGDRRPAEQAVTGGVGMRDTWLAQFLAAQRCGSTRDGYGRDVRQFFRWADERRVDVFRADRPLIDSFRDWLTTTAHPTGPGRPVVQYKAPTIARKVGAVWAFYQHLVDERLLERNPCSRVKRPRVADESTTRALTRAEVDALLVEAKARGAVAYAAVQLLLVAALRVGEVCRLDVADLGWDAGHRVIDVTRKGGRRQRIAIPGQVADALDAALAVRPPTGSKALLLHRGLRIRDHHVQEVLIPLARRAGIGHVTPHMLRHTAATSLFTAGVPARDVQELLGHRHVTTTYRYDRAGVRLERSAAYRLGELFAPPAP